MSTFVQRSAASLELNQFVVTVSEDGSRILGVRVVPAISLGSGTLDLGAEGMLLRLEAYAGPALAKLDLLGEHLNTDGSIACDWPLPEWLVGTPQFRLKIIDRSTRRILAMSVAFQMTDSRGHEIEGSIMTLVPKPDLPEAWRLWLPDEDGDPTDQPCILCRPEAVPLLSDQMSPAVPLVHGLVLRGVLRWWLERTAMDSSGSLAGIVGIAPWLEGWKRFAEEGLGISTPSGADSMAQEDWADRVVREFTDRKLSLLSPNRTPKGGDDE